MQGTQAFDEAMRSRKHMRQQFDQLQPIFQTLLGAYGQFLKAEWFSYQAFLWAAELWYAYAIQVRPLITVLIFWLINDCCFGADVCLARLLV